MSLSSSYLFLCISFLFVFADVSSGDEADGKKRRTDDRPKTKDQIDRRRERNRVLARKTRLRKKFFFESLQRQVAQLSMENDMLKGIVKQRMGPEVKDQVLASCGSETNASVVAQSAGQATSLLEKADLGLMAAIQAAQRSFIISDPALPDNPIIFASKGFLELSGYPLEDVLGRNCRFMQGPGTDQTQVETLRKGIMAGEDTSVCLLNYRADGTQFYNQIFVAALRDANKKIINYVGVQVEVYKITTLKHTQTLFSTHTLTWPWLYLSFYPIYMDFIFFPNSLLYSVLFLTDQGPDRTQRSE